MFFPPLRREALGVWGRNPLPPATAPIAATTPWNLGTAPSSVSFTTTVSSSLGEQGRVATNLFEVNDDSGLELLDEALNTLVQHPGARHGLALTARHLPHGNDWAVVGRHVPRLVLPPRHGGVTPHPQHKDVQPLVPPKGLPGHLGPRHPRHPPTAPRRHGQGQLPLHRVGRGHTC